MRTLVFPRRLLLTATGAGLGLLATLLAIAADRSIDVDPEGAAIFVAVAVAGALTGAALTRRLAATIFAAILAALAVPAAFVVIIGVACSSGAICD
jgi:uncharacterized membrane protein YfcA